MKHAVFAAALATAVALPLTASAATTFELNTNGGDGFGKALGSTGGADFGLTLTGNDNGVGGIYTTLSTAATAAATIVGDWNFASYDSDGSSYDPFGYFINDVYFQLSDSSLSFPAFHSGEYSFSVAANDVWGFYIYSTDGRYGAANATVFGDINAAPAPVPLPAAGLLLLAGLGGTAAMARRKRAA